MKKFTFLTFILLSLSYISCSEEQVLEPETIKDPNFRVTEKSVGKANRVLMAVRESEEDPCFTTNLIAGQHHIAGTVTVTTEGDDLVITYTTNDDWTIEATHMSIGGCEDQDIPTTRSGNPKIGKFEHSTTHSDGVTEVSYYIDLSAIDEVYCFAAHAEVTGPTGGETAWAEGTEFDGTSWAMYVEALLSSCDIDDGGVRR